MLTEIVDTHKNLLITFQNYVADALNNEDQDLLKKAYLAIRSLRVMKGKDVIEKSPRIALFDIYIHAM